MKKSLCLCILLAVMLFYPESATEGARYGLLLWYNSVVPALFPFMVISGLIVNMGGVSVFMTPIYVLLHRWLPISKNGCYVLTAGLLCGLPMGAKTCADFVKSGQISTREGKFLMAVCSLPSPMFLFGYVHSLFSESFSAAQIAAAIYLPLFILAPAAGFIYGGISESLLENESHFESAKKVSMDEMILQAAEILCRIGGYLILFSIIIVFVKKMTWIPKTLHFFLIGSMEMTTAVRELAAAGDYVLSFPAAMAALAFTGFSGLSQVRSVSDEKKTGLSVRSCFFWKLAHAALSFGCAAIFMAA